MESQFHAILAMSNASLLHLYPSVTSFMTSQRSQVFSSITPDKIELASRKSRQYTREVLSNRMIYDINLLRPTSWPECLWPGFDPMWTPYVDPTQTKVNHFDAPEHDKHDGTKIATLRRFFSAKNYFSKPKIVFWPSGHLTWPSEATSWPETFEPCINRCVPGPVTAHMLVFPARLAQLGRGSRTHPLAAGP